MPESALTFYKCAAGYNCLEPSEIGEPEAKKKRKLQTEPVIKLVLDSTWGQSTRPFSLIETRLGPMYADRTTGSLYDPITGQCQTNTRMRLLLKP